MSTIWRLRGQDRDLSLHGMIMGILNVTPDSFSDGGAHADTQQALEHARRMISEGADILDVGGESTRPGAAEVSAEEEIRRILPVVATLRHESATLLSVDTMKAEVARVALEAGADIVNDVNGLRDPAMLEAVAASQAAVVVMHMQGTPRTMQHHPHYTDVVAEVRAFFEERLATLAQAGIAPQRVALDPGIGFGKTLAHNQALLRALPELRVAERPLLLGVSRKSMIGLLLQDQAMAHRDWPTVALTAWLREAGADILRVHEVRQNRDALSMVEAILAAPAP